MTLRTISAIILSVAMPLNALAAPHVIAQLGDAPLIGQIASTGQLQADVSRQSTLFQTAGSELGLSPREYAQFAQRIAAKQVSYVTIPRHLDAMSWSSGGRVYVLRDVVVPAGTRGWEVDLREGHQLLALFVPARCGNLSVVRKTLPVLARTMPVQRRAPIVEAAATSPPAPAAPPNTAAAESPVVQPPAAPAPAQAPVESVATSTAPATAPASHHMRLWPLLLIPLVAFLAGGHNTGISTGPNGPILGPPPGGPGGGGAPPPGSGSPPPGSGSPPPAGCPSPAPAASH